MNQNRPGFIYLKNTFSRKSDAKTKSGVFVGPEIRELTHDVKSEGQVSELERAAWKSFKNATTNFLEHQKEENYFGMVTYLVIPTKLWDVICF